jgi:erythronate-4-phosphate dehydrogenase
VLCDTFVTLVVKIFEMITIIIDEHIPFIKGVLEPYAKIIYAEGGLIDRNMALSADGLIIRTRTRCNADLLNRTPVKLIASATIGYDHIDTEYCAANSIQWYHAPGCNSSSVNQYIASVLAILSHKHGYTLKDKKIGIIGAGNVGRKVAKLSASLGLIALVNDPPRERNEGKAGFTSMDEITKTADIITFHVPLNLEGIDRTYHLADQDFFDRLQNRPFIINTSRGEVLDTESVKAAIKRGKISGFAADVWENEPQPDLALMTKSLIATPHIAGYSVEGKANGTAACVNAASNFFGFGFDGWYPPGLPLPQKPEIFIDTVEKSDELIMAEAILACYNAGNDDASLRQYPDRFEHIRNHYPVRREFNAYRVHLGNPKPVLTKKLKELGFSMA